MRTLRMMAARPTSRPRGWQGRRVDDALHTGFRRGLIFLLGLSFTNVLCARGCLAQQADPPSESAVCSLEDGRQMIVRYIPVPSGRGDLPFGKIWIPGNSALTLFTETDVSLNGKNIPVGAYTMYLIPGKKAWTAVVSRNTAVTAKYDEKDDLARAPMEIRELGTPEASRRAV